MMLARKESSPRINTHCGSCGGGSSRPGTLSLSHAIRPPPSRTQIFIRRRIQIFGSKTQSPPNTPVPLSEKPTMADRLTPTPRLPGRSNPPHPPLHNNSPNKPSQLLNQMYASLSYIQTRHPYGEIPGQPSQAPQPRPPTTPAAPHSALSNGHAQFTQQPDPPTTPPPENPDTFDAALRELARDLVLKEQQIEVIINSLPGLGNSEAEQVEADAGVGNGVEGGGG